MFIYISARNNAQIRDPEDFCRAPGADKNDHHQAFVRGCQDRHLAPHVACK